ncbi:hypothetical protein KC19_VG221900 [Ceratodon purpureus]|uniref:Ribonuclease H1 N-terminal domain-containing protein n=1 Tax=Ceratodon purpureus TaxID=3225 RepID=A0A8T0HSI0_CERPU|nr:hypothetical protein KC19_VG221900 [Ceratodon purpureus]
MDMRSRVVGSQGSWADVVILLIWSVAATVFFIVREVFEAVDRWVMRRWRRAADGEDVAGEEHGERGVEHRQGSSSAGGYESRVCPRECLCANCFTTREQVRVFPSDPSVGRKHKLGFKSKFNAVRRGRVTRIYLSWEDCNLEVCRFRGAEFKSFETLEEATSYLAKHPTITTTC